MLRKRNELQTMTAVPPAPGNTPCPLEIAVPTPHPKQTAFFDACSDADERALQVELEHGQRDPIHVIPPGNKAGLPAYTILDGHRRVEALNRMGRPTVLAIIRYDLRDADAAAVEHAFINFNLVRRQLHALDKANAALRLFVLEKKLPRGLRGSGYESEARNRVGTLVGVSGRHLQRLFNILMAPREVQRAVRDGHLKIILGEKVAGLPAAAQVEIAAKLSGLADRSQANDVVAAYFTASGDKPATDCFRCYARFVRVMRTATQNLDCRVEEVRPHWVQSNKPALVKGAKLIQALLKIADRTDA